jgi:hypothetical protein
MGRKCNTQKGVDGSVYRLQFYFENVKEFYKTECTENPCFKASSLVNFQEVTLSYPQQMHVVYEKNNVF